MVNCCENVTFSNSLNNSRGEFGKFTKTSGSYFKTGVRPPPPKKKKIGLGLALAGLMLRCETRSCFARRDNDLEGHSNF